MLEFASYELRDNFEIIMEAVKEDGFAIEFASTRLKNNFEIVNCALNTSGYIFDLVGEEIRKNRQLILKAYQTNIGCLNNIPTEYKNDIEFFKEIININPRGIEYASYELQDNYDLIMMIVKKNGVYLKFASSRL